jgi:hypothetical protein
MVACLRAAIERGVLLPQRPERARQRGHGRREEALRPPRIRRQLHRLLVCLLLQLQIFAPPLCRVDLVLGHAYNIPLIVSAGSQSLQIRVCQTTKHWPIAIASGIRCHLDRKTVMHGRVGNVQYMCTPPDTLSSRSLESAHCCALLRTLAQGLLLGDAAIERRRRVRPLLAGHLLLVRLHRCTQPPPQQLPLLT